jgi:hypothetical protein
MSRVASGDWGSIPIARSTLRCLACPCVVLGHARVVWIPQSLIDSVDRSRGLVRSRWSHPSVIDPDAAPCHRPLPGVPAPIRRVIESTVRLGTPLKVWETM